MRKYTDPKKIAQVLALSGGIDSAAIFATHDINLAVFVDYGQPAAEAERRASKALAERFDVPWREVEIRGMRLGEMIDETGKPGLRVVQCRNAIIATVCANQIDPAYGGYVYFGAHKGDEQYPDCGKHFFDWLNLALGETYRTWIFAPNLDKTKAQVLAELGRVLRNYDLCWSCYTPRAGDGDMIPCGTCTSCVLREEACSSS